MKLSTQTVYSKALAIYVAMSFLLGLGVVSLTQAIIVREFRIMEKRDMQTSVERLQLMLDRTLSDVSNAVGTWLVEFGNTSRRIPEAYQMESLGLDFVAVFNEAGDLLGFYSADPKAEPIPRETLDLLAEDVALFPGAKSQYLEFSGTLVALAWQKAGTDEGSIILLAGRFIRGRTLAFLESLFEGKITFTTLQGQTIGAPGTEGILAMFNRNEPDVTFDSNNRISGSFLVRGLNNGILGVLTLTQDRPLEEGAQASVRIFLTVLALASGVLFVAVWFLLDRTILARIHELTRRVEAEKEKGLLPVKLDFPGDDELGTLARRIEEMAGLLEKVQSQYRQVVEDQTELICRFDENFHIQFSNEVFRKLFPITPAAKPESLRDCIPADSMEFLERRFRRLYPTSPIDTFIMSIDLPESRRAWFRSTLRRNFHPDGTGAGGQWVAADVTLQVEAEKGVQESERQLRQLSSRLLHLQDEERRRLARELHDSTAQSLSALEMNVSLLAPAAKDDRTRRIVEETRRIAQDCCQELRNISYLLHPPLLDEVGLPFAIQWFIDGFIERTGIHVDLDIKTPFPRMDRDVETTLFRVVQEAASNIYKHSEATKASIRLQYHLVSGIWMQIRDNGKGFPKGKESPTPPLIGIGLAGMRERLSQFGGSLEIKHSQNGVQIDISIPASSLNAKN